MFNVGSYNSSLSHSALILSYISSFLRIHPIGKRIENSLCTVRLPGESMMRWVIFLIGVSFVVCGCATHTTHHTLAGADMAQHRRHVVPSSGNGSPTPQFIIINADIAQGRATVRLHQSPAWHNRQNRSMLVGEMDGLALTDTATPQVFTPSSDKALHAIDAAFERAHVDRDTPQHHLLQQWPWSAPEARFDPLESGK